MGQNKPSEIVLIWNNFLVGLEKIEILRVKRLAFAQPKEIVLSVSLHGFFVTFPVMWFLSELKQPEV